MSKFRVGDWVKVAGDAMWHDGHPSLRAGRSVRLKARYNAHGVEWLTTGPDGFYYVLERYLTLIPPPVSERSGIHPWRGQPGTCRCQDPACAAEYADIWCACTPEPRREEDEWECPDCGKADARGRDHYCTLPRRDEAAPDDEAARWAARARLARQARDITDTDSGAAGNAEASAPATTDSIRALGSDPAVPLCGCGKVGCIERHHPDGRPRSDGRGLSGSYYSSPIWARAAAVERDGRFAHLDALEWPDCAWCAYLWRSRRRDCPTHKALAARRGKGGR